jgi:hypothetical protein
VVRIVIAIGMGGLPGYVSAVISRSEWGRGSGRSRFPQPAPCLGNAHDVAESLAGIKWILYAAEPGIRRPSPGPEVCHAKFKPSEKP